MRSTGPLVYAKIFVGLVLVLPLALEGQTVRVVLKGPAPRGETGTLSISVTPSQVHFNLVARGTAIGNCPVNITTMWNHGTLGSGISLYGSFASSSAAIERYCGLRQHCPAFRHLRTDVLWATNVLHALHTDQSAGRGRGQSQIVFPDGNRLRLRKPHRCAEPLSINLSTLRPLPADTYTGTLTIQAQELSPPGPAICPAVEVPAFIISGVILVYC